MVLGADGLTTTIGAIVSVLGATAVIVGLYLSRRSEREANETQREAVASKSKLDEVDTLRGVIATLTGEVERVNDELDKANVKVDRLNRELVAAQRNVNILRRACEMNGVPIPNLEPMHDVG